MLPLDSWIPTFLACEGPEWAIRIRWIFAKLCAHPLTNSEVSSVEPSSMTITSRGAYPCDVSDSRHWPMVLRLLYVGTVTDTSGLDVSSLASLEFLNLMAGSRGVTCAGGCSLAGQRGSKDIVPESTCPHEMPALVSRLSIETLPS